MNYFLATSLISLCLLSACQQNSGEDLTKIDVQISTPSGESKNSSDEFNQNRINSAVATIEIDPPTGRFKLLESSSKNDGHESSIIKLATKAIEDMNKIIDDVVGENVSAYILNPEELKLTIGHRGQTIYFDNYAGRKNSVASDEKDLEKTFNDTVVQTIKRAKISGGNLYVKRTLLRSATSDMSKFKKDLDVGADFEKYLQNKDIIDAAIENSSTSDFSRGWIISLKLSEANGVRQAATSDFFGGAEGFVQGVLRQQSVRRSGTSTYENIDFVIKETDLELTNINRTRRQPGNFTLIGFLNTKGDPAGWTGYILQNGPNGSGGHIHFQGPRLERTVTSNDIFIGDRHSDKISGGAGNDWIDGGQGADNLSGRAGNDVIIGDEGDDKISGGQGDDIVFAGGGIDRISGDLGDDQLFLGTQTGQTDAFGGAGDDTFLVQKIETGSKKKLVIDGGNGADIISFKNYGEKITFRLDGVKQEFSFPDLTIKVENIENIEGTFYADTLTGDNRVNILNGLGGNDVLIGGAGDDVLDGGAGADILTGGAGIDTVSYKKSSSGVDVSIIYKAPHAFGGDASGDQFKDKFENLIGSNFADVLEGNQANNSIKSGRGDDYIIATNGNDEYHGAEGFDTVDYGNHKGESGLTINTQKPITGYIDGFSSPEGQHLLTGIEHIVGTLHADEIILGNGNDVLEGGKGADLLTGGIGDDTYFVEIEGGHDQIFEYGNQGRDILMIGFEKDLSWNDISFSIKDRKLKVFYKDKPIATAINGPFLGGTLRDTGIEVLDLGGAGQVEIYLLDSETQGSLPTPDNDKLRGQNGVSNLLIGLDGDDEIWGGASSSNVADKGNLFHGGRGDDVIFAGNGNDKYLFDRGSGFDTINDYGGKDHIYFGPQIEKNDLIFETVGEDLYIGIKPNKTNKTRMNDLVPIAAMEDKLKIVNGAKLSRAIETYTVQNKNFDIRRR